VYLSSIHRWFGIFNWDKVETTFGMQNDVEETPFEQLQVPAADAALLLVCVCLSTIYGVRHKAGSQMDYPLYNSVKHTFALLTCLMQPTIELMQCGALIALVEYGNGLFLSAHETLSETVAMARIFDLTPGQYVEEEASKPWTAEEEETCALWWSLFELDQYARTSPYVDRTLLTDLRLIHQDPVAEKLPYIMPAPAPNDLLPPDMVGDTSFDTFPPLRLPQSAPIRITVGNRRRSAQSAVVLHRALLWGSRWTVRDENGTVHPLTTTPSNNDMELDPSLAADTRYEEQDSLDTAIRDILVAMVNQTDKWELFCDCFSMCLSALYLLYTPALPAVEEHLKHVPPEDRRKLFTPIVGLFPTFNPTGTAPHTKECKALAAVSFSARFVSDLSMAFNKNLEIDPSRLTETVVAPAIQTCGVTLEVFLRLGDVFPDAAERFDSIWKSMAWFNKRWGMGGEFCRLCVVTRGT
jgi:hypothetical protein